MIAIAPANSLQERFLNDFVDQVVWQHGSDTQRLCCRLRFHPINKQKRSSQREHPDFVIFPINDIILHF
ncbi:hypothetical protein NG799_15025 [Laspinema sp. D1]|uniref:Uncharacterized protein n=1 Tax=Laspinema palackyanum D2a TaxID=2953684 RepID=A0ABT2MSY6_9CYAN|nr:hypothetical protein [Laspinema sp. D2a]